MPPRPPTCRSRGRGLPGLKWKPYYRTNPDSWRFKTPVIEFGGVAKAIQWDQRQRGDPDNVASRGGYLMKFYAPEAFDGFLTAEFAIV